MQGGFWIDGDGEHRFWLGSKKYDSGRGKTFRHIRTSQERRTNGNKSRWIDGYYVASRFRHLPNYWDEILRHHDKSWKRHRGNQYKGAK